MNTFNTKPITLSRVEAQEYLGLTESEFSRLVSNGILPSPISGINRWARNAIDQAIAHASRFGQISDGKTDVFSQSCEDDRGSLAGSLEQLIDDYQSMSNGDYADLAASTRKNYDIYISQLRQRFGSLTIEQLQNRIIRREFKKWRDSGADNPRASDMRITILNIVLAKAYDDGRINVNYAKGIKKLYKGKSVIRVWTDDDLERFRSVAPTHIFRVVWLGRLTGARLSALLKLSPSNIQNGWLDFNPQKRGQRVRMKLSEFRKLEQALDELPKTRERLFLNKFGRAWTVDGFKASFRKIRIAASIDLHFHDLRATAITEWANYLTSEQIALLTGHSIKGIHTILNSHYLQRNDQRVIGALRRMK